MSKKFKRKGKNKFSYAEIKAYWVGVGRGAQSNSNLADFTPSPTRKGKIARKIQSSFNKGYERGLNAFKNDKVKYL